MAHRLAPERLLTALLDSAEEAILSVSLDGTIETWSAGAERLYGYTAREMTGQSLSRLLPLYEFSSMETLLSQAGCNGCPSTELGERLHKNGSRILLATRRDLIRGENGEVLGILEIARRLESHEAFLSPAEAPLPLLMEQVPGLLWMTDRNLRITSNWGAGFRSAKIRPGSLAGQNLCQSSAPLTVTPRPSPNPATPCEASLLISNTLGRTAFWRFALDRYAPAPAKSSVALPPRWTAPAAKRTKNKPSIKRATTP